MDRPFPSTRPDTAPALPRRRRAALPLRRRRHPRERHEGADQGRAPQNHAAQPPGPRRLALHRHENQPGFRGDDGAGNLSPRARRRPGPAAALTPPTPPRRTALPAPPFHEGGGRGRMLEIAQTPCAVHGGSAERDDDKQQVRSERLSRSCGGASCSAVPQPSHPDRPPSLALLPCSCAAGSASAGPRGERPDFIFLLLARGPGAGPVGVACAVNPDYSCVIYRPWVCVFVVRAIRYQLEDTGSVKLKSTRDPPAPRGPRRRTLVTSAMNWKLSSPLRESVRH